MLKINIVYAYMREPRYVVERPASDCQIIWTREEEAGADAVVYYSGYSYKARLCRKNPDAYRVLYTFEPLSVYPLHFCRAFWKPFDAVLTWNDHLSSFGGKFHSFPTLCYDFPFGAVHGVRAPEDSPMPKLAERRKALCQIVGDKYSPMRGELYSKRRAAARWFFESGETPFDTYGHPAMNVENYKGPVDSKLETLRAYRYALCFENLYHPVWSQGYLTEKIFDCMYADCVPIYYGCANLEKYIPEGCYIDFRSFGSFAELDRFLQELTDEDYLRYVENIRSFLSAHNAPYRYSCERLYETVAALVARPGEPHVSAGLAGFVELASVNERLRYVVMRLGLFGYRFIHPIFKVLRCFRAR